VKRSHDLDRFLTVSVAKHHVHDLTGLIFTSGDRCGSAGIGLEADAPKRL
jgi:ribosomal protein L5